MDIKNNKNYENLSKIIIEGFQRESKHNSMGYNKNLKDIILKMTSLDPKNRRFKKPYLHIDFFKNSPQFLPIQVLSEKITEKELKNLIKNEKKNLSKNSNITNITKNSKNLNNLEKNNFTDFWEQNIKGSNFIDYFVDFTVKYGFAYRMSNGYFGMLFNDGTKLLIDKTLKYP